MLQLNTAQIAVDQSAERLAASQQRYNDAVGRYGAGSIQAIAAGKQLESAQDALDKANLKAKASYVLVGAEMVQLAMVKIPALVTAMNTYAASATGATAATARFGVVAVPVLAGVAAGLAVVGAEGKLIDKILGRDDVARLQETTEGIQRMRDELTSQWEFGRDHAQLDRIRRNAGDLVGWIPGVTTAAERMEDLADALAEVDAQQHAVVQANSVAEMARQTEEAAKRAQEFEESMRRLEGGTRAALSGLGVDMAAFSLQFQENVLRAAGVSEELVASLRPVITAEELLASVAPETADALRDQMAVTKKKDETTEDFIERLKALGYTEEEIKARINETGDALRSQADATDQAAAATERLRDAGSQQRVDPLSALLGTMKDQLAQEHSPFNLQGQAWAASKFNADSIASALRNNAMGSWDDELFIGDVGSQKRTDFIQRVKDVVMRNVPSQGWDELLAGGLRMGSVQGIPGFAHGFEGIVRGPSLFMAGEHGAERLSVTPLSDTQSKNTRANTTVNVTFQRGSIVTNDPEEAARAMARQMQRKGAWF